MSSQTETAVSPSVNPYKVAPSNTPSKIAFDFHFLMAAIVLEPGKKTAEKFFAFNSAAFISKFLVYFYRPKSFEIVPTVELRLLFFTRGQHFCSEAGSRIQAVLSQN
jgi:hypothetical protein